jgi:hypothetical protein
MSTLSTTNLKNPSSGSNNIVLGADGSTTIPTLSATTITGTSVRGVITSGTAVASTSGVSIDFTGIPSWAKRVTVMFNGVSTSGTSNLLVQLGISSGVVASGYLSHSGYIQASAVGSNTATTGYAIVTGGASDLIYGPLIITTPGANTWLASGAQFRDASIDYSIVSTGFVTLSGTLDRVRVTTVNGTDTFDAGSINILYEG